MLIIDEPDIYLHPDLQRRLFWLVQRRSAQSVMATHSIEIINEAEPDDLVVVDKARKIGKRVADIAGMQEAVEALGSTQNIHLTKLSKERKVLFVEGADYGLLRRFARKLQLNGLAEGSRLAVIPVGGFSQWSKIEDAAWTFKNILQADVSLAALFDRDYRCEEEIDHFLSNLRNSAPLCFVLTRKELENYLLHSDTLARAISRRAAERDTVAKAWSKEEVEELLCQITDRFEKEISAQCHMHRLRYHEGSRIDPSTVLHKSLELFNIEWSCLETRIRLVPGKSVLTALNRWLQEQHCINLTHAMIVSAMGVGDVADDLRQILEAFDRFASSR
jgi:hypothetical protein